MLSEKQYLDLYQSSSRIIKKNSAEVLNAVRDAAFEDFRRLGFPSRKVERYKYTDMSAIFEPDYGLNLNRLEIPVDPYEAFRCDVPNLSTSLYFVVNDAFYCKALPKVELPEGESGERRGQASVNATYNNKVAVLVGDFILSTALLHVSYSHSEEIVRHLAELGRILSNGEILQLNSISNEEISEDIYYQVIKQKTAALFEACAGIGAMSANASELQIEAAKRFGQNLGIIFQIRDDIFDYYDSKEIGKPTGNDMTEGKLTLPVIYALKATGDEEMIKLARKVKAHTVSQDEIAQLVAFTKENGGIEYADRRMWDFHAEAMDFLDNYVEDKDVYNALKAYLDFVIERKA